MSLRDDLIRINNSLSSTLHGINSLLPFEVENLKNTPPAIEEAIGSARREGEESGYSTGYNEGRENAETIIVDISNEAIEKYTAPAEDWSELPSKIDEVYGVGIHDGKFSVLESSKYMRGEASGELVSLNDVSPVGHTVGVEVSSKNLANKDAFVEFPSVRKYLPIELDAGTYYYSSNMHSASGVTFYTGIVVDGSVATENNIAVFSGFAGTQDTGTFTITERGTYRFLIYCSNADIRVALDNVWNDVWIQIEKGAVKTPYTPYLADTSAAKIQVLGKNWYNSTFTIGGLAGASGNEYENEERVRSGFIEAKQNQFYVFSCEDYVVTNKHAYDKDKKWIAPMGNGVTGKPQTFKTPEGTCFVRIVVKNADETSFTSEDTEALNGSNVQIEIGTTATEYEPYRFVEYSQGESVKSIHPTMNIMTDTEGASVDVEYLRDIDAYIDNLTGAASVMTLQEPMEEE